MDYAKESLRLHKEWKGKIQVVANVPVETKDDLSLAYTPGVAQPCLEIQKDIEKSYELTRRWNMCLVVTDGSAVLGLGDIGPEAGMPVMEGKCVLFKAFGDVDAFPLCIKSKDVDEIVNTIYMISGSFGGVNLEDISAPRCFEIERKLKEKCDIPIFHDDQHGTAVITLAGLNNAMKLVKKEKSQVKIVMNGAGAAAISIAKLLLKAGYKNITLCDRHGAIYEGRADGMNPVKNEMSKITNLEKKAGSLAETLAGADVFIGVSAPKMVTKEMVESMAKDAVIFACANPVPEIYPTALGVVSKMMMMPVNAIDAIGQSAISELGNMVAGNAATVFANNNIMIDITPPDYCVGASYNGAATEMFTIPFSTEIGDMTIDVRIEQEG